MSRIAYLLAVTGAATAQLALDGVRCGQLTCSLEEYCSSETNRCAPCSVVCNKTHHNFDSGLCIKECQGYLLDQRYQRKYENAGPVTDITSIQTQARAAMIVSGVALAILVIILLVVCKGKITWSYIKQMFKPKNRIKQYPTGITHSNPHAVMAKPKPDLKLEIRNPEPPKRQNQQPLNARDLDARTSHTDKSQGATTPKTMSTALSNRHPAEDTTLDYSYDNMALNTTPEQPTSHRF